MKYLEFDSFVNFREKKSKSLDTDVTNILLFYFCFVYTI